MDFSQLMPALIQILASTSCAPAAGDPDPVSDASRSAATAIADALHA